MAPTATTLSTALWAGDLVAGGRLRSRSIEQLPGSPAWPGAPLSSRQLVQPPSDVPGLLYVNEPARKSGVRLMLHDPPEAPWDWPTSKTRPAAASGSDGGFSGSQDARVPAPGQINGAADPDLLEITFKNDLYHTYRPMGRGGSVITTSEPDTRRVPDINAAYAGLASTSTPDLHWALRGMRAEDLLAVPSCSNPGRLSAPSIPEDAQAGMSGFDAAVPQYNPASQHGPSGSGTVVWDSASSAARMAPVPRSLRGKRGSGDGSPAQQNPFEQHPIDRQASGKAPRASESDQTAPTVARSSGLSRWTSSLSLGTPSRRDSKKTSPGEVPQQQQRAATAAQGLAAQERQKSAGSSMLTSFFGRFGKSAASTPASFIVSALSSTASTGRSPISASPAASTVDPSSPAQPGSPMVSASSIAEEEISLRPLRRSVSEPMRNRRDAVEADAARVLALEEVVPVETGASVASGSRQSREKVRRSDVRNRTDIQSAPPPDRGQRRRRAFMLEDVEDEFVTSDLAQRSSIFNEGLRQVPSASRPRRTTAQRGSEWA